MAKKLKDYYNHAYTKELAQQLATHVPTLNQKAFLSDLAALKDLEFLARQDLIANALTNHLGDDYSQNLTIFNKILGPELTTDTGMFTEGWRLWPIGRYVEQHATEDPKTSLQFTYELTKRFTGEFAIRPLIRQAPRRTLSTMRKWSKDPNVHVRRLSSEGLRISLPWTSKLTEAVEEFDLFTTILTNLKNAPEKFVQKSVGNNLNDLMKYDSDLAWQIINDWQADPDITNHTKWIIKHSTRLLRKSDKNAA